MSEEAAAPKPRATGEAAWKAEREALDQRNAAAKKAAKDHVSASALAAIDRERRLARVEDDQLKALNKRITARPRG